MSILYSGQEHHKLPGWIQYWHNNNNNKNKLLIVLVVQLSNTSSILYNSTIVFCVRLFEVTSRLSYLIMNTSNDIDVGYIVIEGNNRTKLSFFEKEYTFLVI